MSDCCRYNIYWEDNMVQPFLLSVRKVVLFGSFLILGMVLSVDFPTAVAADFSEQQQLVDKAKLTIERFRADPSLKEAIQAWSPETKALFIVPQFTRGAFIFGGAGGSGVLLVRDEKKGWSEPAFYTIGSASFGLQIGADVSEIVMIVRTKKGLEEFFTTDVKLGVETSMAVGPVGEGISAQGIAADIISYASKKGAFAGLSLDGAAVAVSDASNQAYYGKPVRPVDIVVKHSVSNPASAPLQEAAGKLMK
jgi:lipid-binding SYLF domain-containing protein